MPSLIRTTHHGANHDDRSPTTTIRDARSRSTPSTTRSTSRQPRGRDRHRRSARSNSTEPRRKRGKDRYRRNSRSNSTEPRRRRGKNRSRRNARSSSTESSRPRRQNRRRRHARSSSTETSLPRGEGRRGNRGDRRGRSHGPRSRPRGRRSQSRSKRGREHSPQRQRDASRTPKRNRGGGGGYARAHRRAYTTEDRLRDGVPRSQHTPANMWGGPRTEAPPFRTAHEVGRYGRVRVEAPKANNQLRQSITGRTEGPVFPRVRPVQRGKHGLLPVTPSFSQTSILETMYWVRQAARDRAHIARPPRGDAERSDALRDQHIPALIPPSP